ncbi:MAG: PIN-like domain-containing protein [Paludibacteraceae bacterium]|nr:PIN-like domain-containing protein [Paludibacteraceae bacterium]
MLYPENISEEVFENGIVVFDTSALCNLYDLKIEDLKKMYEALSLFRNRIWIPSQVLHEYEKNRQKAIHNPLDSIKQLKKTFQKLFNKSEFEKKVAEVDKKKQLHPIILEPDINDFKYECNELIKKFESVISFIDSRYNTRKLSIEKLESNDVLYDLIKNCETGKNLNFNEKLEILKEGHFRYANKIPPGYMDGVVGASDSYGQKQKNKEGFEKYGDLFIWKEIIKLSIDKQKDILFVGEDKKEDWYSHDSEGKLKPRIELFDEFELNTSRKIVFSTLDGLVLLICKHLGADVELATGLASIRENLISNALEKQRDVNNTIVVQVGSKLLEFPLKNYKLSWRMDNDDSTYYHYDIIKYEGSDYKFELELNVTEYPAGQFYDQEIIFNGEKDCPEGLILREADLSREITFDDGYECSHCGEYYHDSDLNELSDYYYLCDKCRRMLEFEE